MEPKRKPKKFSFVDLTGKDRKIKCLYHGRHNVQLEGRLLREEGENFVVGINLYEEDVPHKDYNPSENLLVLWYHPPECGNTIRTQKIPESNYVVPKNIKSINVYDDEITFFH
ncbi:hypothetical protein HZA97_09500 [Candidatus Woesearchaeota archaeon]|nr:hypothetical protein [Candidatus Woesearchaeota archaeon]